MPQIEINYIDNIVDFSQFKEQEKKKKRIAWKSWGDSSKVFAMFWLQEVLIDLI